MNEDQIKNIAIQSFFDVWLLLHSKAHYDLAISVALWWLNKEDGKDLMENFVMWVMWTLFL